MNHRTIRRSMNFHLNVTTVALALLVALPAISQETPPMPTTDPGLSQDDDAYMNR